MFRKFKIFTVLFALLGYCLHLKFSDLYYLPSSEKITFNGSEMEKAQFFSILYYVWEKITGSLLFIIWVKYEKECANQYLMNVLVWFCAVVWVLRSVWQIGELFGIKPLEGYEFAGNIIVSSIVVSLLFIFIFLILHHKKHKTGQNGNNS